MNLHITSNKSFCLSVLPHSSACYVNTTLNDHVFHLTKYSSEFNSFPVEIPITR